MTHGHRCTWCEKKVRLFAFVILFKMTKTVNKKYVCVHEDVEKPFVRFYEVFLI